MSTISDQHYIDKILQGETNSFAVLVDRYKDMIFTLALKMIKNREEAEEVAQEGAAEDAQRAPHRQARGKEVRFRLASERPPSPIRPTRECPRLRSWIRQCT